MSTATNNLVKTLSEINPEDMPSFSSTKELVTDSAAATSASSSITSFFSDITWQTWLIVILLLAFLGINVFAYLQKGTDATAAIFDKFFVPILKVFGYETLETTKQTVETSATGTKAGVDAVAGTTTGAIDMVESNATTSNATSNATTSNATTSNNNATSNATTSDKQSNNQSSNNQNNKNVVTGNQAQTSLNMKSTQPIRDQLKLEKQINELEDMQGQNLQKALEDASKGEKVKPDDSLSRIQSGNSGKSGWCFIGEDRGFRTCSEIGENDKCMSGDIFPSHEICMNPNLRP
jgi:hypothetical protein